MKKILLICALLCAIQTYAQHSIHILVTDNQAQPFAGATVQINNRTTTVADSLGVASFTLASGFYTLVISAAGYKERRLKIKLPYDSDTLRIALQAMENEEEEITVTATRSSRSINDIPTRVETISGEELAEKGNMKPGEIRMLLSESTGIQTQQTSATSNNSSIRIQGLDGRYTQILKDGFPLYAGFSGGLSIMQITPLDLKQVEVIKGSASTLYGGGAIAGLVNLVSKTPGTKRELSFIANVTSAKGLDLSSFYSQRFKHIGLTVFGSYNASSAYDPSTTGFTALPEFTRYTINPRLFIYGKKTNANVGLSYITETRTGGSLDYIRHNNPGYFEKNNTERLTGQLDVKHNLSDHASLQLKSSYTSFDRKLSTPGYVFSGLQLSSYTEVNYGLNKAGVDWIVGVNILTDHFREQPQNAVVLRDYRYNTFGLFAQAGWQLMKKLSVELGLRSDYVRQYGMEVLPRASLMFKPTPKLTARLGGGLGYKTPSVFNEDAEKIQFRSILPVNATLTNNERSAGANFDLNYRTRLGKLSVSLNQLFFYTRLKHPLILSTNNNAYEFINAPGHIDTRGLETNLKFTLASFKLFVGYTYADVNTHYDAVESWAPLTSRHRLNNVLMYEQEGKLKLGLEAYYFSRQKLNDGAIGKPYWVTGFMAEKLWKKFSVFINFENFTDTRQTRFDTIYTGTISNPVFRDIYAPVDGFVVNGGIKLKL